MLSYAYGAGNIVSSPKDLGILLHSVLNNELLDKESVSEMLSFIPKSYDSWTSGYGLGIHHAYGQQNDTVLGHDGYYTNMTDMFHSQKYDFTLVTMTNTQTEWYGIFNPMYEELVKYWIVTDLKDNEADIRSDLIIYPNPARNQINIFTDQLIDGVEIIDALGRTIYESNEPFKNNPTLQIENNGVYIVRVKMNNQLHTRKLVVSK